MSSPRLLSRQPEPFLSDWTDTALGPSLSAAWFGPGPSLLQDAS